jgi:hypothetical protein
MYRSVERVLETNGNFLFALGCASVCVYIYFRWLALIKNHNLAANSG